MKVQVNLKEIHKLVEVKNSISKNMWILRINRRSHLIYVKAVPLKAILDNRKRLQSRLLLPLMSQVCLAIFRKVSISKQKQKKLNEKLRIKCKNTYIKWHLGRQQRTKKWIKCYQIHMKWSKYLWNKIKISSLKMLKAFLNLVIHLLWPMDRLRQPKISGESKLI